MHGQSEDDQLLISEPCEKEASKANHARIFRLQVSIEAAGRPGKLECLRLLLTPDAPVESRTVQTATHSER